MNRHAKPTGDPDCPPQIRQAKQIHCAIQEKCQSTSIDDDDCAFDNGDPTETGIGSLNADIEGSADFDTLHPSLRNDSSTIRVWFYLLYFTLQ